MLSVRTKGFRTIGDTVWLYPEFDIKNALRTTSFSYTDNGQTIATPTLADFYGLYQDIFNQTTISQSFGNPGFSLGVGTILEDLGKERQFTLSTGEVLVKWRLVRQISPQTTPPIASTGNSPVDTIGYVTVFCSFGSYPLPGPINFLDPVLVVRLG